MNPDPDDVTFQFNQIQLTDEAADVSFGFNQANDGSKLVERTPENDEVEKSPENKDSQQFTPEDLPENSPENADVDSGDDDVTFGSSQVRIKNNKEIKPEDADVDEEDDVDDEDDDVTFGFSQEDADVEGEEFTFMCINSDNTVTELTEKTVFPLFDQSLLHNSFNNNNLNEDGKRINVPVNNVFIESPRASRADTSSSSSSSTTTLTAITDSNEMNIKSNSTGFSKLWRFRDNNNINRSNSDGRDAFVFLNNPKTKEGGFLNNAKTEGGKGKGKGKEVNVVVKKKVKKANVASAHEVYLKQKGGEEESKRKSYLPYRPGLMGFFTNVNGGLSKNVHPF